jgi:hypothetical protein
MYDSLQFVEYTAMYDSSMSVFTLYYSLRYVYAMYDSSLYV